MLNSSTTESDKDLANREMWESVARKQYGQGLGMTAAESTAAKPQPKPVAKKPMFMSNDEIEMHKNIGLKMITQEGKSLADVKAYMDAVGVPQKKKVDYEPGITPQYILGMASSALHGASFGWDDEAIGSLMGLVTGSSAQAGRDAYRQHLADFHAANPTTDFIVQLGAGIATGGAVGGVAKRIAPTAMEYLMRLPGAIKAIGSAAAGGGAYAAGDVQGGVGERLGAVPGGAATGAAFGGVATGLGVAAGKTIKPFLRPIGNRIPGIKRLFPNAADEADDVVRTDLMRDGKDIDEMIAEAKKMIANGQNPVLGDLGGENVLGRYAAVQAIPGQGKEGIKRGLVERSMSEGDRIMGYIAGKTKIGIDNIEAARNGILGARSLNADRLYFDAHWLVDPTTGARTLREVPFSDRLKAAFQNPDFKKAWNEARVELSMRQGVDIPAIETNFYPWGSGPQYSGRTRTVMRGGDEVLSPAGDVGMRGAKGVGKERTPPIQGPGQAIQPETLPVMGLDYMKRYLDKIVRQGQKGPSGWDHNKAYGLREQLNGVLDEVDGLVKEFGVARKTYRGDSEMIDAYDEGSTWLRATPEHIATKLAGFKSQNEAEAAKLGFIKNIRDAIYGSHAKAPDPATTVLGGKYMKQRIQHVFGQEADDFLEKVQVEARMHETLRAAASGSRTTPLAETIDDWTQQSAGVFANLVAGRPGSALVAAARAGGAGIRITHRERVADEIAKRFTYGLDDPGALIGWLNTLRERAPRATWVSPLAAALGGQMNAGQWSPPLR